MECVHIIILKDEIHCYNFQYMNNSTIGGVQQVCEKEASLFFYKKLLLGIREITNGLGNRFLSITLDTEVSTKNPCYEFIFVVCISCLYVV